MSVFKDASLAYEAVWKEFESLAPGDVLSIKQVWARLKHNPHVRNEQQVVSAVQSFFHKRKLSRLREGMAHMYWINQNPTPVHAKEISEAKPVLTEKRTEVPDIKITDSHIYITHSKYKLTLELT